jgi:hypothetical protein
MISNVTLHEVVHQKLPAGEVEVRFPFVCAGEEQEIWFRFSEGPAAPTPDAFIPMALPCAMAQGFELALVHEISPLLLTAVPTVQDIYRCWEPQKFRHIPVRAQAGVKAQGEPGREMGCFFSGGMDSFYSVLKHQRELGSLILVHGFDIKLDQEEFYASVAMRLRDAARELGKRLIEVRTNIRAFSDRHVAWGMYHGAALATIGLLLGARCSKVQIPSTYTYANIIPRGSHPILDPLWSTEHVRFVHDGCEASRVQKATLLATSDVAMKNLRVCWRNPNGSYNCGKCEKCLRTMINLYLVDALGRCTTFPDKLDLNAIARLSVESEVFRSLARENLRAAEARGDSPALVEALEACLSGRYQRKPSKLKKKIKRWLEKW